MVTGSQGTCVVWESIQKPGFAYVDLRGGKSGEKKCYNKNDVNKQPFYLTIPEGTLKPDLQYKFQVKAMASGNGNGPAGTSSLTITTTSGLTGEDGYTLVVEAGDDDGQALLTNYTISVINEVKIIQKIQFSLGAGPFINHVTHLLRGGRIYQKASISLVFSKMGDKEEGEIKNIKKWVTSFMDDEKNNVF